MALNFTIFADFTAFLNLNKCANLRILADFTAIEIHKVINCDPYAKLNIRGNFSNHCSLHLYLSTSQTKRTVQSTSQLGDSLHGLGSYPGPVYRDSNFFLLRPQAAT